MSKSSKADERKRGREAGKAWMDPATNPTEGERKLDEMFQVTVFGDQSGFWAKLGFPTPSEEFTTAFCDGARATLNKKLTEWSQV